MNTPLRVTFTQVAETPIGIEMDRLITDMLQGPFLLYSTDERTALEVVEWLRQQGFLVTLKWMPDGFNFMAGNDGPELPKWRRVCELQYMPMKTAEDVRRQISLHPVGSGQTMPEAVCRAALKAVHDWFRYENVA